MRESKHETRALARGNEWHSIIWGRLSTFPISWSEPRLTALLQQLKKHEIKSVQSQQTEKFQAFGGAREADQRAPDLEILQSHLRHLGALVYSGAVSDANADGSLDVKSYRAGLFEEVSPVSKMQSASYDPLTKPIISLHTGSYQQPMGPA